MKLTEAVEGSATTAKTNNNQSLMTFKVETILPFRKQEKAITNTRNAQEMTE